MNQSLIISENLIFERFAVKNKHKIIPMLFIIASPRTGSTPIYQFLINHFMLYYFTNFVADNYAAFPSVGVAIDCKINTGGQVSYESSYGKTNGPFGPSEASYIFKNWFGGEHPSQTKSCCVISEKEEHLKNSLAAIYEMTKRPLITKNAWNCFRVRYLKETFPGIRFIWFRRDIAEAAVSDLEARYRRGGSGVWNSATTSNYLKIKSLPYWEQVVEQQYEFNLAIKNDLELYCENDYIQLWYEDMCNKPELILKITETKFTNWGWNINKYHTLNNYFIRSPNKSEMREDEKKIIDYIERNENRFEWCRKKYQQVNSEKNLRSYDQKTG